MSAKRKPFSITLDEQLVREAKKRAIDENKTLYEFVEDALRLALAIDRQAHGATEPPTPVGSGRQEGLRHTRP